MATRNGTAARPANQLVRGLDPIPPDVEFASFWQARAALYKALQACQRRLKTTTDHALRRDLEVAEDACHKALYHMSGGFDLTELAPTMEEIRAARAAVGTEPADEGYAKG